MLFNSEHLDSGHNHAGMTPKQSPSGKICAAGADSAKVLNCYKTTITYTHVLNRGPAGVPDRCQSNLKTHGIDFVEAQALWNDPYLVEIPAKTTDEERFLVIGKIQEKHWSAIITPRDGNVRIISVRRSRIEEVVIYES